MPEKLGSEGFTKEANFKTLDLHKVLGGAEERITSLNQKTKDRLFVAGVLALEAFFVFGAVSNFYGYILSGIFIDIFLAILSTVLMAILTVFLVMLAANYFDKKKFLKSFQKMDKKT